MPNWKPQRSEWVCVCGHPVSDHDGGDDWPCLMCDCEAFDENLTAELFNPYEGGS